MLVIAERLRILRESKKLSQGDIEDRTGLLRCYVSRVENGHTIPSIETLEKLTTALDDAHTVRARLGDGGESDVIGPDEIDKLRDPRSG